MGVVGISAAKKGPAACPNMISMVKSGRRWLAGPGGKLSAVVGACSLLLVAGRVALALFAGISSRVIYVCNGEAPRGCNC
jgi:hypothetical protein